MEHTHDSTYQELKALYDELTSYLDSLMLAPQDEDVLLKHELLGEKIYEYHAAILDKKSKLYLVNQSEIAALITHAEKANELLKNAEKQVKYLAKIANAIDKVIEKLGKIL
jgi:hypothetical protein